MDPLDIAFRYNAWANTTRIEFCSTLTPAQLTFTLPAGQTAAEASDRGRDLVGRLAGRNTPARLCATASI
ncbi:MAG: hypothetical protein ACYDAY_06225 [Candidatus Dormibacteria bacterium]